MEENDGNMVRFRLVFDDRRLLDKSLRSQGLRRCWFLLKPGITTIRALASHIRKSFGLHDRIVLFMDDFVLPSFESTSIITDKDIITVKKKEVIQKDICKPCCGQRLVKDSQIVSILDLPFTNDHLSDEKSQSDKERVFSCTEAAIHLDPPDDVGLTKQKRKKSKKLGGSKLCSNELEVKPTDNEHIKEAHQSSEVEKESGQSEENNSDHEFEPSNNLDLRKIDVHEKQESSRMLHHSYDGEDGVAPSAVHPGYIHIQPQEDDTQEIVETQPLHFEGSSIMNGPNKNKGNNFSRTTVNNPCFKIDKGPDGDGLLPLPYPKGASSTDKPIRPKQPVHLKNLLPLGRLPVKDDILVYRCAQQSLSSVYPVLSSPQVGKVSSFDYVSLQIILHPVLDYEILLDNPNESAVPQNESCNKEESIKVDYALLIDVRLLKTHHSEAASQHDSAMKDSWENVSSKENDNVKDSWEKVLAKENDNEHNISPAEQNNGWSQWRLNKTGTTKFRPCRQPRPNAPTFAGRGNIRANGAPNWGYYRSNNFNPNWEDGMKFNKWYPNGYNANVIIPPWPYGETAPTPPFENHPYKKVNYPYKKANFPPH